jgi:aspartyl-tRNA(Asn)/glutamyl-tRNA(Gln) amidotransferase subunit C
MDINKSEAKRIIKLTSLSFSQESLELYREDLINMISLFDKLKEVDTYAVKPLYSVLPDTLRLREDITNNDASRNDILKNAPENKSGFFAVPKIID